MAPYPLFRYPSAHPIETNLDPFQDLQTWLEYLVSADYVRELLTTQHGLAPGAAKERTKLIVPHVKLARDYIDQAQTGPRDIAFLPSYYAILNLIKVYILLGAHYAQLPFNRHHGATYDGFRRDSQSLLTERVTLKPTGALPLLYRTLTNKIITRQVSLTMGDIYPSILDVSEEFTLASGDPGALVQTEFYLFSVAGAQHLRTRILLTPSQTLPPLHRLKALVGFRKDTTVPPYVFISPPITDTTVEGVRRIFRPYLFYQHVSGRLGMRVSGARLLMPEEFPIALAFFHMSSVVRYKPEFLARLKDSQYWPVLSTLRRHALFKFLYMFWSYAHQETLMITHAITPHFQRPSPLPTHIPAPPP